MNISSELAQPIVSRLRSTLDCPISITDKRGTIVASTDNWRVGNSHEVAIEAIATRRNLQVSKEQATKYKGTFEGITSPLILHGRCVGALCLRGVPSDLALHASIINIAVVSLLELAEVTQEDSDRRRLSDIWVNSLISDSSDNFELIAEKARLLGIDCQKLCSLLVITFHPMTYSELPALELAITEVAKAGQGLQFASYVGQGQFVCAVLATGVNSKAELEQTCENLEKKLVDILPYFYIGVGRPSRGINGYRKSYSDALHCARVVERLGDASKHTLYFNEQHIFRLLESVPERYRDIYIGNLTEEREWDPVLLETLHVYFTNDCHVNQTAKKLYIHRNTLLFRLNKVADQFGLDPRKFHDSMELRVLLYLLRLSKNEE